MRPRRGCAAGSHAGCARADCWCESAANAPPGRRSKRVSPRLPLPPAQRRGSGAGHAASRSLGWPSRVLPRGLMPSEVKKLRQLEEENGRLRKVVADLTLDKEMLQEVIRRKL